MEPISRQLTSQSNKSILVTALDQGGPMISHTMETINHNNSSDDDDDDEQEKHYHRQQHFSMQSTHQVEKIHTTDSDTTIQSSNDNKKRSPSDKISSPPASSTHMPSSLPSSQLSKLSQLWKRLLLCSGDTKDSQIDPHTFSTTKKSAILFIVASAGASSPLASTVYYPALIDMQNAFHTTDTAMNASISVFTFFTAFFPLLWATAGDKIGRRKIYLISFFISVIGSLCCGLSVNITMFILFRAFSAIGSSSVMSMGAGTLADVFTNSERGRAFSYYTLGPLMGPAVGPIIGGYLNAGLGFRSTFYFLTIYNFCVLLAIFFFLPETWRPPATAQSILGLQEDKQLGKKAERKKISNPLEALNLLLNINIALAVTFVGVLFFALYIINTTFSRTYATQYGLDSGTVGVCYLSNAVGCMIGGIAGGRTSDARYNRAVSRLQSPSAGATDEQNQQPYPEMRLGGVIFYGAIVLNLFALTAYGWCVQENVHYAYGVVCQFFVGIALMVPNVTLSTYMVDCFRKRSASVTACNNFARYIMAGIGSLISSDLQNAMKPGPLFTMLGGALAVFTVNILVIQYKANTWRLEKARKQLEKEIQTAGVR